MFIRGMNVLRFARLLCPDCLQKYNALLDGEIEEVTLCNRCRKIADNFMEEVQDDENLS